MDTITSVQNPKVKLWKKLLTAKGRKKEQAYLLEGWHLVEEALKTNMVIECIATPDVYAIYADKLTMPTHIITEEIALSLADTMTSQFIFCVVKMTSAPDTLVSGKYILLDSLQDPGNVGTIVRSADAAGFTGVIVGDGSVDIYNAKTIRSMQGSQFHIPIYKMNLEEAIQQLKAQHIVVYGTALDERACALPDVPYADTCAIIVGNEGNGISSTLLQQTDNNIYIPILGQAESLNVGVAASILMYYFSGVFKI